jgi:hypothetical protein
MCMVFALALLPLRDSRSLSQQVFQQCNDTENGEAENNYSNKSHAIHHRKQIPVSMRIVESWARRDRSQATPWSKIAVR